MKTPLFKKHSIIVLGVICSMNIVFFSFAWGADYPTKPINLVVGAAPGGPLDTHARILGEVAGRELGVPMVIINKAGPGGALAASSVANEKPDGYSYLVTSSSTMTANFAIFPNLSYKRTDLIPVFMSMLVPITIAVRADSPYKNLKELLDAAKKNPGKIRSGSYSPTISLVWEGLLKQEKLDVTHMMYKGASEAFVAVMGGHIDCYLEALTPLISQIDAGKVRLLAFIGSKRYKHYPDVPTLKELGYSSFSRDFWSGFYAPAGLPKPIMDKIVPVFEKTLSLPSVQARMEKAGVLAQFMGPKEFADFVDEQYNFFMDLAKQK
jgi:tripartite-type tricarboxylate transporter receptor subunit TctC